MNTTRLVCSTSAAILALAASAGLAEPLPVEDQSDYGELVEAIRAAEYVRSDAVLGWEGGRRSFAAIAGLMAFAELNPDASADQLALFLGEFDQAIRTRYELDPDLRTNEHLLAAVRFSTVEHPDLDGLDTRVGERALALLGITIPKPDGFIALNNRMARFERALGVSLPLSDDVYDLLVRAFYGVDPSGAHRSMLPTIVNDYIVADGQPASYNVVRADLTEVNDALLELPDYQGYLDAIVPGAAYDSIQAQIFADFDSIQGLTDAAIARVAAAIDEDPSLLDGVFATQAEIDAELAILEANLRAATQDRVTSMANGLLLQQSAFNDIERFGSMAHDFSEIALEVNNDYEIAATSVSLAGNLAIALPTGIVAGSGADALSAAADAVTDALGLAGIFNSGPSVDEQVFDQVVELRQQVEEFRQETLARFDRIDAQLDVLYDTVMLGFNALGDQIADISQSIDSLVVNVAAIRSQIRGLEAALYGVAQDILLSDLIVEADLVLNFRVGGEDLPYANSTPSFVSSSSEFFSYATSTAFSESFAGSRTNPSFTIFTADDFIGTSPVAGYVNDLAVLPQQLGGPPLTFAQLPGVEPWSQAAASYAQLARENPWYFAFLYRNQLADFQADPVNNSPPDIDVIADRGQRLVDFIDEIREIDEQDDAPLFDLLFENYRTAVENLQAAIDGEILAQTPASFKQGGFVLDFWGSSTQNASALVPTMTTINLSGHGDLDLPSSAPSKGYRTIADHRIPADTAWVQLWTLLQRENIRAASGNPNDFRLRAKVDRVSGFEGRVQIWLGTSSSIPTTPGTRSMQFTGSINIPNQPPQGVLFNNDGDARSWFVNCWNVGLIFGGTIDSIADDVVFSRATPNPGEVFWNDGAGVSRLRISVNDGSFSPINQQSIWAEFHGYREDIRASIVADLGDPTTSLGVLANELDNAEALIDAYVTYAMPKELDRSDVLRSALRGAPGTSEVGLRGADAAALIGAMDAADSSSAGADTDFSILVLDEYLLDRIDIVEDEIKAGLKNTTVVPGYLAWTLAELETVTASALELAIDDTYSTDAGQTLAVSAANGVLTNDVEQQYRVVEVDTAYISDPAYVAPMHGTLSINADGSFTYTPDAGFSGKDRFTYRSSAPITSTGERVFSEPAVVVLKVEGSCPGDLTTTGTGEGLPGFGEPDGVTDIADLLFFVNAWDTDIGATAGSLADVTTTGTTEGQAGFGVPDGVVDIADLLKYVNDWLAGRTDCP